MSAVWRHADFASSVGEHVTLRAVGAAEATEVSAQLVTCTDPVRQGDLVSYSVTLLAESRTAPTQGLYSLLVGDNEPDPIFLVPITAAEGRVEYQAVFNQFVNEGSDP